jgi:hypothetical protein
LKPSLVVCSSAVMPADALNLFLWLLVSTKMQWLYGSEG